MRQVIIMKEYEGLKFSEIADVLGIPISTVKTRMYTGLSEFEKSAWGTFEKLYDISRGKDVRNGW